MVNQYLHARLNGALGYLNATYTSTVNSASAVKGAGRSEFISAYLEQVLPQGLRIKTNGEITDSYNNITGELDIIIENGMFPNIPLVNTQSSRLYFAEGVAAVIEVKSNLSGQWNEVISTGERLWKIKRNFKGSLVGNARTGTMITLPFEIHDPENKLPRFENPYQNLIDKVPYFVVGYTGWTKTETIENKLMESPFISGILQLDQGFFCSNQTLKGIRANGSMSLLAFIDSIYEAFSYIKSADADLLNYGK